jgi:N-acetyl-anhydromuramyl-L-alanine amidase AmpD
MRCADQGDARRCDATVGIELVGFGKVFTTAQVNTAARVWRALVSHYAIPRDLAMITHESIDPTRRDDPGPVWMGQHAANVLDFAYHG